MWTVRFVDGLAIGDVVGLVASVRFDGGPVLQMAVGGAVVGMFEDLQKTRARS